MLDQINNRIQDQNGRIIHQLRYPQQRCADSRSFRYSSLRYTEVPDSAAVIQTHFGDITRLSIPMINPILAHRRSNAGKKPSGHLDTADRRVFASDKNRPPCTVLHAHRRIQRLNHLQTASTMRTLDDDTLLVSIARVTVTGAALWWHQQKSVVMFYMRSNFSNCAARGSCSWYKTEYHCLCDTISLFFISCVRFYSALLPPHSAITGLCFCSISTSTMRGAIVLTICFNWWLDSFVFPFSQLQTHEWQRNYSSGIL